MAGLEGHSLSRDGAGKPDRNDPKQTSLVSLVVYVLGFMAALGALAFLTVWLMRG